MSPGAAPFPASGFMGVLGFPPRGFSFPSGYLLWVSAWNPQAPRRPVTRPPVAALGPCRCVGGVRPVLEVSPAGPADCRLSPQLALTLKRSFCSPATLPTRPRCPWWSCPTVGTWPKPLPTRHRSGPALHPVLPPAGGPHSSFVTAWMLFPAMLCKMGFAVLLGEGQGCGGRAGLVCTGTLGTILAPWRGGRRLTGPPREGSAHWAAASNLSAPPPAVCAAAPKADFTDGGTVSRGRECHLTPVWSLPGRQ